MQVYRSKRGQYDEGDVKHIAFLSPDQSMQKLYEKGNALIEKFSVPNAGYLIIEEDMTANVSADMIRMILAEAVYAMVRNTRLPIRPIALATKTWQKIFELRGNMPVWQWLVKHPIFAEYVKAIGCEGIVQKRTTAKYKVVIAQVNLRTMRKIPRS